MSKVYFISEQYLKDSTPINLNVDMYLLSMSIQDAQLLHIQNILGAKLYKKIESLLVAGSIDDPGNEYYSTLLNDYLMRATAMWALYESLTYIRFKIVNKGVQNQTSDNSVPTDLEGFKLLQSKIMNSAEYHSQRVANYLLQNMIYFPEYMATQIGEIQPDTNQYFCGMQLEDETYATERFLGLNSHIIKGNI